MAEPQQTSEITLTDCRAMIDRLMVAIGELRATEALLAEGKAKSLWVFKVKSYRLAIQRLDPFVEELRKARFAVIEGQPQDANSRKTRGLDQAAKKSTKKGARKR